MQHITTPNRRAEHAKRAKQNQTPRPQFRGFTVLGIAAGCIGLLHAETFTLQDATFDQMQKAMDDGALTSVELTSMFLNRIAIYDRNGIKLNAVPVLNPAVLQEAAAADTRRAQGTTSSPLNGIPFGVKDMISIAGLPCTNGEKALADFVPIKDAFAVAKLKESGAIAMGMTNMISAGGGVNTSLSEIYGRTLNPFTLLSSGGSSCGTGAAVGANLLPFGLGIENSGSIRYPSIVNGNVGLTPSRGLVSNDGCIASETIRQFLGPITKNAADNARVIDVIARGDSNDQMASFLPPYDTLRPVSYPSKLGSRRLDGKKFGVPVPYNAGGTGALAVYQPGVIASFQAALAEFRALGAEVVEVTIPGFNQTYPTEDPLLKELGFPADYDAYTSFETCDYDIDTFFLANDYFSRYSNTLTSFQDRANLRMYYRLEDGYYNETYETLGVANALEYVTGFQSRGLLKPAKDRPRLVAALNAYVAYYQQTVKKAMDEQGLSALLVPGLPDEVWKFEEPSDEHFTAYNMAAMGIPFVSMPMPPIIGAAENTATSLTPQGILVIGRQFDEANLLSYAATYEAATHHRQPSALTPALPGETIEYSTALPPPSRPELNAPALRVAAGAKVAGKGKKATLVLTGGAVDASGLGSLTVYVNGKKIAAKKAKNWKASVKLSALRSFVKGSAKTVQVTVVAKDIYGNTSVTTKTVKLPKTV